MKPNHLTASLLLSFTLAACIQSEPLNQEAAIDSCTGSSEVIIAEVDADARTIEVYVVKEADLTKQTLTFELAPGATITPANGSQQDFTTPLTYTVVSEDKRWTAAYTVTFFKADVDAQIPTKYTFEDAVLSVNKKYYIFYDSNQSGSQALKWASGNPGYELTGVTTQPLEFPTAQAPDGVTGNCLKLTTRSTGSFGTTVKMPIAAGNLFVGTFNIGSALTSPLKATRFGFPFYHQPKNLKGWYKYQAGSQFTQAGKPVADKTDQGDIYALFYETTENSEMLDGTHNFTDARIVSYARITNQQQTDQWTAFNIPFKLQPGKSIDKNKLQAGRYKIAIVFSSSIDGALFNGAIGSTLYVDEVELTYQ